jgi:uncharacterized protein YbaR (Trm112 family)
MPRAPRPPDGLVCPNCGSSYPAQERFCPSCRLPLTYPRDPGSEQPVSGRHATARKIKPQLAEGELVRVAGARNQAEAEFIQGMLLEEGVPSMLRRSAGFDVPDFLAAGPRDILVAQSGVDTARQVLLEADLISPDASRPAVVAPGRLLIGLLIAAAIGAAIVWIVAEVLG